GAPRRARRDRFRGRLACPLAAEHVAPPLQAELARHWFACAVADAGDLMIERIERKERTPFVGRCEQRGEIAVLVGRPDQRLAVAIVLLHRGKVAQRAAQSTAIRAAPTRRRSPNRML